MYQQRRTLYQELEQSRQSRVIAYITGDRRQLETKIHSEVMDFFIHHLDTIVNAEKITLYLYTRGGDTLAAWSIANLIRQFCNRFEVVVPFKCHSGGTLICLGADTIVMTKQASLGPIDPSVITPLNPQVPGGPPTTKVPVSVEAVSGFLEFAKTELVGKFRGKKHIREIMLQLGKEVHPLVLGEAFRARSQIQMLARKLITPHIQNGAQVEKILNFLCSQSGSHDYTINRREARQDLGLPIETPDDALYNLIKQIYDDIASDLQLTIPFDPNVILGANQNTTYSFQRVLIESVEGGSHAFISEGALVRQQIQPQRGVVQMVIADNRQFEGWRHEAP